MVHQAGDYPSAEVFTLVIPIVGAALDTSASANVKAATVTNISVHWPRVIYCLTLANVF